MLIPPNYLRVVTARLACLLSLATFWSLQVSGSNEQGFLALKVHRDDGTVAQYRAYPAAVAKLLFPAAEVILEQDASTDKWKIPTATILKKVQTVSLSDTARRFKVTGVLFGDQLFIFDQVFSNENALAMSQLIRTATSAPRNEAEALDLAKLYLALSYYRLEDPTLFVAYKESDSAKKEGSENTKSFSDIVGISHSPQIVRDGATYTIDFYTFDAMRMRPSRIDHWQINIGSDGLEERISAHNEGFHEQYSVAAGVAGQAKNKVRFSVEIMANGSTNDGADTDIQSWDASDGPGVQRVHYYYGSHEKAEKRMNDSVQNALAVAEARPWLDSEGKSVGTQALLIRVNGSEKTLLASGIFADKTSVLEISCSSLTTLMAALSHELPDWKYWHTPSPQ